MLQINIGSYSFSMKYLFKRSSRNTYYYKRRVPKDLQEHYPKPFIEISLRQTDRSVAAAICQETHLLVEEQFKRLRQGLPRDQVLSNYQAAAALLKKHGLTESDAEATGDGADEAKESFLDSIDDAIRVKSTDAEYAAFRHNETAFPYHLLDEEQRAALAIAKGEFRLKASQYPAEYLRLKNKDSSRRNVNEANNAMTALIACCGDKPPGDYPRSDINLFINQSLKKKKTATVLRQLRSIAAMFNYVVLELDITADKQHRFEKFNIPNLGDDAVSREDFTQEHLLAIREMPPSKTLEIDCMIHLMLDTGMRIKECCGLFIGDVNLQAETPHLVLYKNNIRGLKNKNSQRLVPLVGAALNAVEKLISAATNDYLFPRYVHDSGDDVKNTGASGACNKRLKSLLGPSSPTCHSFRHTMQTRLRNTECPKEKRDELGGWAKDISDKYGTPSDLKLKAKYLSATL
jgi:integrase